MVAGKLANDQPVLANPFTKEELLALTLEVKGWVKVDGTAALLIVDHDNYKVRVVRVLESSV